MMNISENLTLEQKIPLLTENIGEIRHELVTFIKISRISIGDALVTARRIVEFIVNGVLEREGFEYSHELIHNIETLGGKDSRYLSKRNGADPVLPTQIYSGLHNLRIYGNSNVHPFEVGTTKRKEVTVNHGDIDIALALLIRIVEWYFIEYQKGPQLSNIYDYGVDPSSLDKYLLSKTFKQVVKEYVAVNGKEELREIDLIPDAYAVEYEFTDQREDNECNEDDENVWYDDDEALFNNEKQTLRQGLLTTLRIEVPRMVILGPPGIGKSTSLRYLVNQDAERYVESPEQAKYPIYVELKNYTPGNTLNSLIMHATPLGDKLTSMLNRGAVALYLDGLNEVIDKNQFNFLVTEIKHFTTIYTTIDLFITCRPKGYENYFPLPAFNIRPFSDAQIREYLNKNYDSSAKGDAFFESLQQNAKLKQICENPFILRMMVSVVKEEGQIPDNTGQLVRRFMKNLCMREKVEKNASFDPKNFRLLLSHLALSTRTAQQQVFSETNALRHIEEKRSQLRIDSGGLPFLQLACDMCILEQTSESRYSFVHELFQEYYAAEELVELASHDENEIYLRVDDPHWGETLILCAGLIENREHFIRLIYARNSQRAAECLSSSTKPEVVIAAEVLEAAKAAVNSKDQSKATEGMLALIEIGALDEVLEHVRNIKSYNTQNKLIKSIINLLSNDKLLYLLKNTSEVKDRIIDMMHIQIAIRASIDDNIEHKTIFNYYYNNNIKYCPLFKSRIDKYNIDSIALFNKILLSPDNDVQKYILSMFSKNRRKLYHRDKLLVTLLDNGGEQSLLNASLIIKQSKLENVITFEKFVSRLLDQGGERCLLEASHIIMLFNLQKLFPTEQIVQHMLNNGGEKALDKAVFLIRQQNLFDLFPMEKIVQQLLDDGGKPFLLKALNIITQHKCLPLVSVEKVIQRLLDCGGEKLLLNALWLIQQYNLQDQFIMKQVAKLLIDQRSEQTLLSAANLIEKHNLQDLFSIEQVVKILVEINNERTLIKASNLIVKYKLQSIFLIENVIQHLLDCATEPALINVYLLIQKLDLQDLILIEQVVKLLIDYRSEQTLLRASDLIVNHNLQSIYSIEMVVNCLLDFSTQQTLFKALQLIHLHNLQDLFSIEPLVKILIEINNEQTLVKASNLIDKYKLQSIFPIEIVIQHLLNCATEPALLNVYLLIQKHDIQDLFLMEQVIKRLLELKGEKTLCLACDLIRLHNLDDLFPIDQIVHRLLEYNGVQTLYRVIKLIENNKLQSSFLIERIVNIILMSGDGIALIKATDLVIEHNLLCLFPIVMLIQRLLNNGNEQALIRAANLIEQYKLYSEIRPKEIVIRLLSGQEESLKIALVIIDKFNLEVKSSEFTNNRGSIKKAKKIIDILLEHGSRFSINYALRMIDKYKVQNIYTKEIIYKILINNGSAHAINRALDYINNYNISNDPNQNKLNETGNICIDIGPEIFRPRLKSKEIIVRKKTNDSEA